MPLQVEVQQIDQFPTNDCQLVFSKCKRLVEDQQLQTLAEVYDQFSNEFVLMMSMLKNEGAVSFGYKTKKDRLFMAYTFPTGEQIEFAHIVEGTI